MSRVEHPPSPLSGSLAPDSVVHCIIHLVSGRCVALRRSSHDEQARSG